MGVKIDVNFSTTDRLCGSAYYTVCTAADVVQTVTKVAFAALTALASVLLFGQSQLMNATCKYAAKDLHFSASLLLESARGIIDPVGAYQAKLELHSKNMDNGIDFTGDQLKKINLIENLAARILFLGKAVLELPSLATSGIRFGTSLILSEAFRSEPMEVLYLGAAASFGHSVITASMALAGVFRPVEILENLAQ